MPLTQLRLWLDTQYRSHNGPLTPPCAQKLPDSTMNREVSSIQSLKVYFERQGHQDNVICIVKISNKYADGYCRYLERYSHLPYELSCVVKIPVTSRTVSRRSAAD
jgi:hypothetical protein